MGRRIKAKRSQESPAARASEYQDAEGNILTLRDSLSRGSMRKLSEGVGGAASTADDQWQRLGEMLFERLAVSWTIAGLPLTGQKELLGRYRMADADTRRWVRETLEGHFQRLSGG